MQKTAPMLVCGDVYLEDCCSNRTNKNRTQGHHRLRPKTAATKLVGSPVAGEVLQWTYLGTSGFDPTILEFNSGCWVSISRIMFPLPSGAETQGTEDATREMLYMHVVCMYVAFLCIHCVCVLYVCVYSLNAVCMYVEFMLMQCVCMLHVCCVHMYFVCICMQCVCMYIVSIAVLYIGGWWWKELRGVNWTIDSWAMYVTYTLPLLSIHYPLWTSTFYILFIWPLHYLRHPPRPLHYIRYPTHTPTLRTLHNSDPLEP